MYLNSAPEHLFIMIKRFNANDQKLDDPIEGINEIIELPKNYFRDGKGAKYQINGAVIHSGHTSAGHYTALRKAVDSQGGEQYLFADDQDIWEIPQEEFMKLIQTSYMIFLKKIQPDIEGAVI